MKVTGVYDYRKDGTRNLKAYKIALTKSAYEKAGHTIETEFEIEYHKDKIILHKKKEEN